MLVSQTRTHLGRPSFHVAAPVDLLELTFSTIWTSISLYDSSEVGSRPNSSHGHVISEYILKSSTLLNYWTIDWTRQPALIFPTSSPNATFLGVRTQGAMTPKFELGRDFCTMRLPRSFIILCLLVRKLSCWQKHPQTNKQTDATENIQRSTLRCWAITELKDSSRSLAVMYAKQMIISQIWCKITTDIYTLLIGIILLVSFIAI